MHWLVTVAQTYIIILIHTDGILQNKYKIQM